VKILKRILLVIGALVLLVAIGGGIFVYTQCSAFDASMAKVYDVPVPNVTRSTDEAVLARGKHLAESLTACNTKDCHGADMGGGATLVMGPLGTLTGPNLTTMLAAYSDGELVRLIKHGIKKDGRSVRFMPIQDFNWLPESDTTALVSYLRTLKPVDRPNGPTQIGWLGKVLDRQGKIDLDIARIVDHAKVDNAPAPSADANYGRYVIRLCTGCHGKGLSGGRIPGAPSEFPEPLNLTPHETGLKGWTYEDFDKLLTEGMRKNGQKLHPFMPVEATSKMDEIEKKAMWAYLQSVPPTPKGNR
jgi:cytochrome c553